MEAPGQGTETTPKPGKIPPRLRLPIVLAMAAAVAVVAWAYADRYGRKHDLEIDRLKVDIQQLGDQSAPPSSPSVEPEPAGAPSTFAGELDGHRFQVDLPEGYRLSLKTGPSGGMYADVVSGPDDSSTGITIELLSAADRPHVEEGAPGHRFVPTANGTERFWIVGTDFEENPLPEFDRIAASFKAL